MDVQTPSALVGPVWPTLGGKFSATVSCYFCKWQATHRGDSGLEVHTFLRARIIEHVLEQHPEQA